MGNLKQTPPEYQQSLRKTSTKRDENNKNSNAGIYSPRHQISRFYNPKDYPAITSTCLQPIVVAAQVVSSTQEQPEAEIASDKESRSCLFEPKPDQLVEDQGKLSSQQLPSSSFDYEESSSVAEIPRPRRLVDADDKVAEDISSSSSLEAVDVVDAVAEVLDAPIRNLLVDPLENTDIVAEAANNARRAYRSFNLAWASEEILTAPTKFRHGNRRSSVRSGEDFDADLAPTFMGSSIDLRRRSNSELEGPSVLRSVPQFGDFPLVTSAPFEKQSPHDNLACPGRANSQEVNTGVHDSTQDASQNATGLPVPKVPVMKPSETGAASIKAPVDGYYSYGPGFMVDGAGAINTSTYLMSPSPQNAVPPPPADYQPMQHPLAPLNQGSSFNHSRTAVPKFFPNGWSEQKVTRSNASSYLTSPAGGMLVNNSAQVAMSSHDSFRCTFCDTISYPTMQQPLVFCEGCGPQSNIRYCSISCLLVHALRHSRYCQCMQLPQHLRMSIHLVPSEYILEQNSLISLFPEGDSPEKFRQKAFSTYCHSGPFPEVARAWSKVYPAHNLDLTETAWKRTGSQELLSLSYCSTVSRCHSLLTRLR